ncbi:hypothetical protein [Trichothermofontia sp.]
MNPNSFFHRYNWGQNSLSGLGCWFVLLAIVLLLGPVGLRWIVNGLFILLGLVLIAPIVAFVGLRWWLQRQIVQDQCPACRYEFTGLANAEFDCPNCGTRLEVQDKQFVRLGQANTVDVTAIEVPVNRLEDSDTP